MPRPKFATNLVEYLADTCLPHISTLIFADGWDVIENVDLQCGALERILQKNTW